MVYINSCEKCKCDCENGMILGGVPHKFCGENMVSYFCPINQGAYQVSLETARKNYGYNGKAFDELDVNYTYGEFQNLVETLCMISVNKPFRFSEVFCPDGNYIEFKVNLSEYSVFQILFTGRGQRDVRGFCDKIIITTDGELIGFVGYREVVRISGNSYLGDKNVYNVVFKHLK